MLKAITHMAGRHPRRVVAITLLLAVVAGALGGDVAKRLGPYGANDPATESAKTSDRLARATGLETSSNVVALMRPASPSSTARVTQVLHSDPAIGRVSPATRSRAGNSAYVVGVFRRDADDDKAIDRIRDRLQAVPGVTVGGGAVAERAVNKIVEHDLVRAELMAFPLLFLLSFWFFRSLVAALLPPLVGGLAIVFTFLAMRAVNEVSDLSVFAINLVTGLGLGLAIDWSFMIVSRYREELARSGPGREALQHTVMTAGRTVLFSSFTVAAALASLMVFPQRFLYSMGVGGALVALIGASVALLILPAVLALLGERGNSLSFGRLRRAADLEARGESRGVWDRLSHLIMRRPALGAIVSGAVLILLGLPALGIRFTSVDATVLPTSEPARKVDTALRTQFPPNRTSPLIVAAEAPRGAALDRYVARLRALPGAQAVTP